MKILLFSIMMSLMAAYGGYLYGRSCVKTQIIEKQVEVIKYVAQKRAEIQARPNAERTELLELMRAGRL